MQLYIQLVSRFVQNTSLIKINTVAKTHINTIGLYSVPLTVHLQCDAFYTTCPVISDTDLICIFELIQIITATFSI